MNTLILVYNADNSSSSKMFDGIHKIISPSTYKCDLCLLTHNWFGEKETWKSFVKNHKSRFKMMYKNEFEQKYPLLKTTYPAIYTFNKNKAHCLMDKTEIAQFKNIEVFIIALEKYIC